MASPGRRTNTSLEDVLFERGYEFEFFQAVRLLSRIFPEGKQVGGTAKPAEEIVRFRARLSMAFPASAVHDIERTPDQPGPASMTVAFMGLTGTKGILPFWYTEWLLARKTAKDGAAAAFFDLFNHRFLSLFYRAWQKHRPPVLYELADGRGPDPDSFTHYLFDLIGMGTEGLRGRLLIDDQSLLLYAGLIAQRPHSATALRGILRDFFSVPVEIEQCIGSWYELEIADRCYLSGELERNQLGEGAFIGDQVWNQQARIRIRIGPLTFQQFRDLLPDRSTIDRLVELTRYIVGYSVAFDIQIVLKGSDVPWCRLTDEGPSAVRLGWMGWLKTEEFTVDTSDTVFTYVN
jgi:type VI secretion system protein ImpH